MTLPFRTQRLLITLCGEYWPVYSNLIERFRHICIYSLDQKDQANIEFGQTKWISYLDRFIIVLPESGGMQSLLWQDFYSYYADSYEKLIDTGNNIACMNNLYSYIREKTELTEKSTLLDYGCGTGLSYNINVESMLIGYEPNDKMRGVAQKRGLPVLDSKQIRKYPQSSIQAVFACYVFHMGMSQADIRLLKKILRPDGIIVANFYKNMNYEYVNNLFFENGFQVAEIQGSKERFGCIYEYRKSKKVPLCIK